MPTQSTEKLKLLLRSRQYSTFFYGLLCSPCLGSLQAVRSRAMVINNLLPPSGKKPPAVSEDLSKSRSKCSSLTIQDPLDRSTRKRNHTAEPEAMCDQKPLNQQPYTL